MKQNKSISIEYELKLIGIYRRKMKKKPNLLANEFPQNVYRIVKSLNMMAVKINRYQQRHHHFSFAGSSSHLSHPSTVAPNLSFIHVSGYCISMVLL